MRLYKSEAWVEVIYPDRVVSYDQRNEDGRMIAIDFEIRHTNGKEPSQGAVSIYNLSEQSGRSISTDATGLRVFAGFDSNEKLIYEGSISTVEDIPMWPDRVIKLSLGDGYQQYTQAVTSKTYASGTERQVILADLARDMGLSLKQSIDAAKGVISGDLTLDGLTKDVMEQFTQEGGDQWTITDNEVHVSRVGRAIDNDVIVLASDSGLLETPTVTEKGVNIRALLNPDVRPGKVIRLEATGITGQVERGKDYSGFYLVQSAAFIGNNYSGDVFDMNLETVAYEP